MRSRVPGAVCLGACLTILGGCAARTAHAAVSPRVGDRAIVLNNHRLRLHFANPGSQGSLPLLVYATGDGGWHRKDLAAWRHLVPLGNPLVGFDARDYVTHLGAVPEATTTPARLAADYERIIDAARDALQLPAAYPVVLVGVSRGAGLSVVAAGQRTLRPAIAGVLAVALTREEEYVKWFRRLRLRAGRPRDRVMVEVYDYLPRLADMPIAVIQSTRDGYLPAADARALFGPNTPYRWLQPIQARNHSFGGARTEMYRSMQRSLQWIESLIPRR
jgi:Bacterial virulence protein (VirJ)